MSLLDRLTYGASQGLRVSWYFGQKLLAARMVERVPAAPGLRERMPETKRVLRDLGRLLERDLRNIEEGRYALPADLAINPVAELERARHFFADLPRVEARRKAGDNSEVLRTNGRAPFPRYYLQNFHFQTDGWLSADSASLYDHQVEVLFGGAADAMRRQALVPLGEELARIGVRAARLLDVGCGTGRFLREVKHNFPRLSLTALDFSPFYLAEARRKLDPWSGVYAVAAPAEAMPFAAANFDLVTCIYLFHELPPKLRRQVAGEIARVLKPGGLLILVDSLQLGDEPDYDALLEHFPAAFHEPYYASYVREDFGALFAEVGLRTERADLAYFSRIASFRRS
jgi:ubiquinone/menaquinone biosynthesis C-methylase UbiE